MKRNLFGIIGGAALAFGFTLAAHAADFSGKRVEILIPAAEGGGSDTHARFFATFLSKYLPGKPTVVVRNMPGGGHSIGGNYYARNAKPDGTDIFSSTGSTQFPFLLGDRRVQYDYANMRAFLNSPFGGVVYLPPELGVKSARDISKLKGVELRYASQGPATLDLLPLLSFEFLGLNVRAIFGFRGRGDGRLAFERGDANIDYQTTGAYQQNVIPLIERGRAVPLFSWGALNEKGDVVRDPTFPDLPHFLEVYQMIHGKPLGGIEGQVWKAFFAAGFGAQKFFLVPKGTPQPIYDALSAAVRKSLEDPDFKARSSEFIGAYTQYVGKAAEQNKSIATEVSPEARQWVLAWLKERYKYDPKK
jgi:tripartite-type tricarboxylate transporter receptor subunit TctC